MGVSLRMRARQWMDRRLLWPLADTVRYRGGRVAVFTGVLCLALGAWTTAMLQGKAPGPLARSSSPAPLVQSETLKGVTPTFKTRSATGSAAAKLPSAASQSGAEARAGAVARRFSAAFLDYEVGHVSKATATTFARTATRPVARSLKARPPRLPAKAKVPRGRIRNVIVRTSGAVMEASVAVVRRGSLGELRLTLRRAGGHWRVSQVRA